MAGLGLLNSCCSIFHHQQPHIKNLHMTGCPRCSLSCRTVNNVDVWCESRLKGIHRLGVQGSRGATLPVACALNPCWLLYWCSHCSDLSSLPLMWPLVEAIKDQRASPQTRCFTWQVLSAACPWNIQSEWKTDELVKNVQKVTGRHKAPETTGVCQGKGHSRYGFNLNNSEHTVHQKTSRWCKR